MDTVYLDGSMHWTSAEPLGSLPGLPKFMEGSTANQRGYDATWSIVAYKLFLVALAARHPRTSQVPRALQANLRVLAQSSGALVCNPDREVHPSRHTPIDKTA